MKLTIGFSSCPNDTFIFDALVHKKIDTHGIDFSYIIDDVEELNQKALQGQLDITKLSYFAYAHAYNHYKILDSGSALGYANGPLFICKKGAEQSISHNSTIAIPGKHTTAHVLFSMAYPEYKNKKFYVFHEIEDAIRNSEVDAGVIIHENRFTYSERGFAKLTDLGEFWDLRTKLPIPLGAIVIKRNIAEPVQQLVNTLIKQSIEYSYLHPESAQEFIKIHAQEMQEHVKKQHIELFVNNFSLDLGIVGKQAVNALYTHAYKQKLLAELPNDVFLNP